MKRTISLILAMLLSAAMLLCVTGCDKKTDAAETDNSEAEPAGAVAGGWNVYGDDIEANIPAEAQEAFDKAVADMTGAGYKPLALLGTQVVAGVNYAFLCRTTIVTAEPIVKLSVVTVYKDLEGNAKILNTADVNIADYNKDSDVEFDPADMAGGWTVNTEYTATLPENVNTAYEKAMAGLMGVSYKPLAYMGSQVVAGSNYAVLCAATSVTADPANALAVVIVYADLNGGAEVRAISGFSIAE